MSLLDQIFAPEKTDLENSATGNSAAGNSAPQKSPLEIPPPEKPHDCGCPLFWKSTAGFFRCLGCAPPANRNLAVEIFDVHRQAGCGPHEQWGGEPGWPANRNTGTGAGGDAGGADRRSPAEIPSPDFSIDSPVLFFDPRRGRWVGSVRELMGYGERPGERPGGRHEQQ